MTWKVERWGGASHHKPRIVFMGSEDLARTKFRKIYLDLRQGLVRLIDPGGNVVIQYGVGRGRSPGNILELRQVQP